MKKPARLEVLSGQVTGPVSPAVQLRVALALARKGGFDFDTAWASAFASIRWPHDTTHRREWKKILSAPETVEAWRAAYEREACASRQLAMARLVAA